MIRQLGLFGGHKALRKPPTTRYQGSKLKLVDWIWEHIHDLPFRTALDAFGGTGSVSYMLKAQGKTVTYNEPLKFNHLIGTALIENSRVRLSEQDIDFVVARHTDIDYDDFIARTFVDTYFTDAENGWLDVACHNIRRLRGRFKRALAYYALFQSCISKRPYNLFHRKNLYMRTASVTRNFGNKATWDKPFEEHFRAFADEANRAVFDSGVACRAVRHDALAVPGEYDLVYIDPPYISKRGVGVDYRDFYHFLEGMVDYGRWEDLIDWRRKHRPLRRVRSPWSDPKQSLGAFESLFDRFADAILVVSYRSDGIPSLRALTGLLGSIKSEVRTFIFGQYKYVLSTNGRSQEALLIGL